VVTSTSTILIAGAGQLGSRYLQGLAACTTNLRIFVHDPDSSALAVAISRWDAVGGAETGHVVSAHDDLVGIPRSLDLTIVATTASVRPMVVEQIADHATVRMWILEKVLAQSDDGLERIRGAISAGSAAWVNTWARATPWYHRTRGNHAQGPVQFEVLGGSWGLACNAIHFLDLIAWWTGEALVGVDATGLDEAWLIGRRPGNLEVSGSLAATYTGGTTGRLYAAPPQAEELPAGGSNPDLLRISGEASTWTFVEPFTSEIGLATSSAGIQISGRIEFQSERTAPLVDCLLGGGASNLTDLSTSIDQHRIFLHAMLEQWRASGDRLADLVPIT